MKLGVALSRCNPAFHADVAVAADELDYGSIWLGA